MFQVERKLLDEIKKKLELLQTDLFLCLSMLNELYKKAEDDKAHCSANITLFPK